MSIAMAVRGRASCLGSRVGAILVLDDRIVSTGYNGTPEDMKNCDEGGCDRCLNRDKYGSGNAYDVCICVHAEQNVLLSAARFGIAVEGGIVYTTMRPCFGCTKELLQAKIRSVYYIHDWKHPTRAPPRVGPGTRCGTSLVYTSGEPRRLHMITTRFALIPGLLLTLGGCMTNATVELTKAPFDATTQLTNGTSGATKEFLDPTTEFTSSTTPGALADGRCSGPNKRPPSSRCIPTKISAQTSPAARGNILRRWLPSPASRHRSLDGPSEQHEKFLSPRFSMSRSHRRIPASESSRSPGHAGTACRLTAHQ
jgi:deoxycytidylate deaminase